MELASMPAETKRRKADEVIDPGEEADAPPATAKRTRVDKDLRVRLNPADCDLDFDIWNDGLNGQALHEDGFAYCWSGARATVGIISGKYCFACKVISEQPVDMPDTEPDQRHLCRVGISRGDVPVGSLGEAPHSFGFGGTAKFSFAGNFIKYGAKFGVGDTICCAVDLDASRHASITFSKNGECLGVAKEFGKPLLGQTWESAIFPHVLLKNAVVEMQFSLEDGLVPLQGYKPWSNVISDGKPIFGPVFPDKKDCEVIMMVGLPAAGKTTWAEKMAEKHPEKRYVLLGTNLALDKMKVPGLHRKGNYGERFDRLMDRATSIFNTCLARAAKIPRNYIIDQTNVYKSARIRKLKPFPQVYRKIAVVIFPNRHELKIRAEKRFREMGKEVPAEAVNEMIAHFVLPVPKNVPRQGEPFDEVKFVGLSLEDAQRSLDEMKLALGSSPRINTKSISLVTPLPHFSSERPTKSPAISGKVITSPSTPGIYSLMPPSAAGQYYYWNDRHGSVPGHIDSSFSPYSTSYHGSPAFHSPVPYNSPAGLPGYNPVNVRAPSLQDDRAVYAPDITARPFGSPGLRSPPMAGFPGADPVGVYGRPTGLTPPPSYGPPNPHWRPSPLQDPYDRFHNPADAGHAPRPPYGDNPLRPRHLNYYP